MAIFSLIMHNLNGIGYVVTWDQWFVPFSLAGSYMLFDSLLIWKKITWDQDNDRTS